MSRGIGGRLQHEGKHRVHFRKLAASLRLKWLDLQGSGEHFDETFRVDDDAV